MIKKIQGFTLVELLIVIAIISILVTMVIIAINPIRVINDSKDTKMRSELNQVKTALQLYFNENNDYPTDETDLVPVYTKQLPDWWSANGDFAGGGTDYAAGVTLNNPDTAGDDAGTATKCNSSIIASGLGAGSLDYFICPD